LAVTTEGSALVLIVPFFGAVVVAATDAVVFTVAAVVAAEVDAGTEVAGALEAGAAVLEPTVGGVIVTPFSAQSSTATETASV
jgi:hypothetical protein